MMDDSSQKVMAQAEKAHAATHCLSSLNAQADARAHLPHLQHNSAAESLVRETNTANHHAGDEFLAITGQATPDFAAAAMLHQQQITFLAMVAHELRNPLAPLRNAAELLVREDMNEARLQQLKGIIVRQVARMDRLVNDLLHASRGISGKFHLECSDVDMHEMLMTVAEACRPAMESRRQRLTMNLPELMPDVRGDAVRLTQVFGNLLDNASRYTPAEGGITLTATVGELEMSIVVADTGIGISAEALPHIFDLFVQEKRAVRVNAGGLGIGLSVVRDLVHAHGGTVTASSSGPQQGSAFTVSLPRGKPVAADQPVSPTP
jgi:signal transduction histidine kinase